MKRAGQISLLLVLAASSLMLTACGQKANCSGISFGGNSGTGGATGGVTSGGSVCGNSTNNNGGGAPVSDFVYYLEGNTLNGAALSGTSLTVLPGFVSPPLGVGTRANMAVVNEKFLYEPWIPAGGVLGIQGFSINHAGGVLTAVPGNPAPASTPEGDSIAADPQGRFLFVGDYGTSQISVFLVDPTTGALTEAFGSPFSVGSPVSVITVDGTGQYLYAADFHSNLGHVFGFNINQTTGDLTAIAGSPWSTGMFYVQADPLGKYLFGLDLFGNSITVLPIELGTGILLPGLSFPTASSAYMLDVHPNGNFVYTFALDSKNKPLPVEGFQVDASGNLTALTGSPFTAIPGIFDAKFDQNGTELFGLLYGGSIQVLGVDPTTGSLSSSAAPLSVVSGPFVPTN